jgi:hypothetical protein
MRPRRVPNCHPGKQHAGRGLCRACYKRSRRWKRIIREMRFRVKRCLNKKAPKPRLPKMSDAERERRLYNNNLSHRLKCVLRKGARKALQSKAKRGRSIELLGCSIDRFKLHIENQFEFGMSWSNYGKWHLDHIRPCASFDLRLRSHQQRCFHFTNYRPLWARDNILKNSIWRGRRRWRPGPSLVKNSEPVVLTVVEI